MDNHHHRSALVHQLARWPGAPADAHRQGLAERLGQWVNVADAIALSSVHQAMPAVARERRRRGVPAGAHALQAELDRLRATLSQAITGPAREPGDEGTDDPEAGFAPHQRRCHEQQRRMDMGVEALRGHVRKTLSQTSARLAQLAALDAVLEGVLGGREQRLLATVPTFLKARWAQLRQAHPGGWQPLFEHELQQTLLAELDLRLQPVLGLVEALSQEVTQHP